MLERHKVQNVINMNLLSTFKLVLVGLLWITTIELAAQVVVHESPYLENLVDQFVQKNLSLELMSGYRLQVVASDDRRKVDNVRGRFSYTHPEYKTIWKFSNPYYKVLAGAFRTKLEAEHARSVVGQSYNNVLIVIDNEIPRGELAP